VYTLQPRYRRFTRQGRCFTIFGGGTEHTPSDWEENDDNLITRVGDSSPKCRHRLGGLGSLAAERRWRLGRRAGATKGSSSVRRSSGPGWIGQSGVALYANVSIHFIWRWPPHGRADDRYNYLCAEWCSELLSFQWVVTTAGGIYPSWSGVS